MNAEQVGRLAGRFAHGNHAVIQDLERDAAKVKAAREYLFEKGLYGRVTVNPIARQSLPYVDNLVTVLIAEDAARFSGSEMMRVAVAAGDALDEAQRRSGRRRSSRGRRRSMSGRTICTHRTTTPWPMTRAGRPATALPVDGRAAVVAQPRAHVEHDRHGDGEGPVVLCH